MCEIYSKLTIKTTGRRDWRRSGAFITLHVFLVFLLLTLSKSLPAWYASFPEAFILFFETLKRRKLLRDRRIQNQVEHLRWRFSAKWLTAESR